MKRTLFALSLVALLPLCGCMTKSLSHDPLAVRSSMELYDANGTYANHGYTGIGDETPLTLAGFFFGTGDTTAQNADRIRLKAKGGTLEIEALDAGGNVIESTRFVNGREFDLLGGALVIRVNGPREPNEGVSLVSTGSGAPALLFYENGDIIVHDNLRMVTTLISITPMNLESSQVRVYKYLGK
jgi:hypothetical protein